MKKGEPTILFESGGGNDGSQWKNIQRKLDKTTNPTIISYDRAGFGKSGLPNTAYDLRKEVQDLHYCLKSLGVEKIILVSHSYGAFLNQAYQFMYPENILGIILVDPNNQIFVDSIGVNVLMRIPFDTTKSLSIREQAEVRQVIGFPQTVQTIKGMPFSKEIPMIVISAGKGWWPFPKWNKWWKNSHESIAGESVKRELIIDAGSAHDIPKENPDLVAETIRELLRKISLQ